MVVVQQATLRLTGALGAAIFASFFALTFSVPGWVERFATDFIEAEVNDQIDTTIDELEPSGEGGALSRFASSLYEQNQAEIERLKAALKANVHERMAGILAEIRDLDCECRDQYAQMFEEGFQFDLALLQAANDRIVEFVQSTYMEVVAELKRDIRIFTASNFGVFLLLLLVSFLKPQAIRHLFLPGVLLLASTLICSYFYIFEQNWLLTIIYSDYLGFAYLAYLGVVFLILCDIVFNKARVTTEILNAIFSAIGSAVTFVPC